MIWVSVKRDPLKEKVVWTEAKIGALVFVCLMIFFILIAIILMTKQRGKYDVEKRRQQTENTDSNDLNETS